MKDELEREKCPRMPWHDVHCALWGSPCRDIARHFVQRWNHAKVNLVTHTRVFNLKFFLSNVSKHYSRETKPQMKKKYLYLCLNMTWSFHITWEEARS